MDFATEFVALRDRMQAGQGAAFVSRQNEEVAGRVAALLSSFGVSEQRKVLGLMPMGGENHSHEYRLLFAVPALGGPEVDDWWDYAARAEQELVQPDAAHGFSIVSLILAAGSVDKEAQKKLKKLAGGQRRFSGEQSGWSTVRAAAVDLSERKIYTTRPDGALKNVLAPFL